MRTKARFLVIALMALIPLMAMARLFQIIDPKTLIADSKLVFVGKVQSVKASGIATRLSYPTWDGVSFPWLEVEMEVLVPFKGVRKGEVVNVMMLSIHNTNQFKNMYSPPQVLEPDKGDVFFLCLGPTPVTNAFAAYTAPYNEFLSVMALHRSHETNEGDFRDFGKKILLDDERFSPIWKLVDKAGKILPDGAKELSQHYAKEIRKSPAKKIVYLEWESHTNEHGWSSDVPKGSHPTNSGVKN